MNTQEAEIVDTQAIAIRESAPPALFGTTEPVAIITKATAVADALKGVIKKQGLISVISGKEYPKCEAWTLLGTMLGVFPVCVWTKQVEGGWEARVEARARDGAVLGAAEAQCLKSERNWSNRDDFALRSMAQTRATAKCLRMPLGFVMTLSGFEVTPAEEMVYEAPQASAAATQTRQNAPKATTPPPEAQSATKADSAPFPTAKTRSWMIEKLQSNPGSPSRDMVSEFFVKSGIILETEAVEDIPLRWCANSESQIRLLAGAIAAFSNGDQAGMPYKAHTEPNAPKSKPIEVPRQQTLVGEVPDEPWAKIIVPIPHKGEKRVDYLKHPDTIGSLFAARHTDDVARSRLFGFFHNYTPKPWTGNDGKERPPSQADVLFRQALDDFGEWFQANHPDEQTND